MAVDVQGKGSGGMPQIALHGLDIIPGPDSVHGIAVRVQVPGEPFQKLPGDSPLHPDWYSNRTTDDGLADSLRHLHQRFVCVKNLPCKRSSSYEGSE